MFDEATIKEQALSQFYLLLREKINYIASDKCWTSSVAGQLSEINEMINAATSLGAISGVEPLTEEQIGGLGQYLRELKALKLEAPARAYLVHILVSKGIDQKQIESRVRVVNS